MIFAAYFILTGNDTHINFLQLLFLPSDARAFSFTSFEKQSSSIRLNKGFGLFNFSGDSLLDLNNFKRFSFWP